MLLQRYEAEGQKIWMNYLNHMLIHLLLIPTVRR
jgi:hypothetical protein